MKKLLSVVLCAVMLCTTFNFLGINFANNKAFAASKSITFDLSDPYLKEYVANETTATDSLGNTFYPLHSAKADSKVSYEKINVTNANGSSEVDSLQIVAAGHTMFIPTDSQGKPYELSPNSEYEVTVKVFVKAVPRYDQLFFGGGALGAYRKDYTTAPSGNFVGTKNCVEGELSAIHPIYRSTSLCYQDWGGNYYTDASSSGKLRYFEDYNSVANKYQYYESTVAFSTGDYTPTQKGFMLSSGGTEYSFGNYFCIKADGGTVNAYMDGQLKHTAYAQYNIIELTVTRISGEDAVIPDAPVGDYYSFDFSEGGMPDIKVNETACEDSVGNTYYPLHSAKDTTNVALTQINASTTMGEETLDTLELKAYGHTLFIPTDKDGKPYELDPNSAYEVKAKFYVKAADTYSQVFFGGGAYGAYAKAYQLSESKFAASERWNETEMSARFPIYRSGSLGYQDWGGNYKTGSRTVRYFDNFDSVNNRYQYYEGTEYFITGDYEKLSRGFALTNSSGKTTFGNYFTVMTDGGTVNAYDKTSGELYATAPVQFNFVELKITKLSEKAVITFDANDGAFADGSKTKDYAVVVGNGVYNPEIPVKEGYKLKGWSLEKGGEVISDAATKDLHEKTVYAVYEKDEFNGYDRFSRYVDFSNYYVKFGVNCNRYTNSTYTASSDPYMSLVDDESAFSGRYLHFECESNVTDSLTNFNITVTPTGDPATLSSSEENIVLPNNTTYRVKIRYRANTVSGGGKLSLYTSYGTAFNNTPAKEEYGYTVMNSNITKTEGWQEVTGVFTTPENYYVDGSKVYNKFFIGFKADKNARTNIDIDYIKLEKVCEVSLYGVSQEGASLQKNFFAQPGDTIDAPEFISSENYADDTVRANIIKTDFEGWFADEALTVQKQDFVVGNQNIALYGKMSEEKQSSTLNQTGFCGFDTYSQDANDSPLYINNGIGCVLTDEDAYTGTTSLKAVIDNSADRKYRSFEVKNFDSFALNHGTTYKVDFAYKADSNFTIDFSIGEQGVAANSNYSLKKVDFAASENWTTTTVYVTADLTKENYSFLGFVPVITLESQEKATVYMDTITVSSAVGNLGVSKLKEENAQETGSQALRFYMSYETEDLSSVLDIADEKCEIAERGVLFKGEGNAAELTVENTDKGVIAVTKTEDFDSTWDYNGVTNTLVFSAYVNGFNLNDERNITARGYIKLSDNSVLYSSEITVNVADLPESVDYTDLSRLNIVSGELVHSSVSDSSIKTNSATVSMNDAYIFLPAGSKITATNGVKVYAYDEYLEVKEDALNPAFVTEYTMDEGKTVRLVIKGGIDDVKIQVPTDVRKYLLAGDNEFMTYGTETDMIDAKIQSGDSVNYIFITDIHYEGWSKAEVKLPLFRQMNTVIKLANENENIDFVAIGGDIITGVNSTAKDAIDDINEILEPLKNCTKPVFVMIGNHDDNCYHIYSGDKVYYPERMVSERAFSEQVIDRYNPDVVHDTKNTDSRYYYYDLENKKTRVIVLDSIDYDYVENEDGSIKELVEFTNGWNQVSLASGSSYWGYSAEQLNWLIREGLTAPDGYNYIFLSHMGIDGDTNSGWGKPPMYGKELRSIISAFQNKTVFNNPAIGTADYTKTNGRILSYNFGHIHAELVLYSSDINLYQISTATPNIVQYSYDEISAGGTSINNPNLDWRFYRREYNTINEACFDIVCSSEKGVNKYAFGAGGDYKGIY